jgi:alkylhydroperoxidase/carboxymuconolactone decarboxylase family protein YurZ
MTTESPAPKSNLGPFAHFRAAAGAPADALAAMIEAIYADTELDSKTRELVFLGIQTALRLHEAVRIHVPRAIKAGATRAEILSVMMMTVPNAGMNGPIECWPIAEQILDEQGRK